MESERPSQAQREQEDAAAFREFVAGLQMLSRLMEVHSRNFAWCAAQLMGSPDAPERIKGMIEFAVRMHAHGLETSRAAIRENQGVRVDVAIPRSRAEIPGIVVEIDDGMQFDGRVVFAGIALVKNRRGQEMFARVEITPNGETCLLPEHKQPDEPEIKRLFSGLGPNC